MGNDTPPPPPELDRADLAERPALKAKSKVWAKPTIRVVDGVSHIGSAPKPEMYEAGNYYPSTS